MKLTDIYQIITEKVVEDPELVAQIKEFAELSDEIDRVSAKLKLLQNKYKNLEDIIRPVLEELDETKDKALEVENILVTIKRKGFDRTSYAYKDALEWVRKKINPAMQKIVDDSLKQTEKTATIASQIGVQKLEEESKFSQFVDRLKGAWKSFTQRLDALNNKLSQDIDVLKSKVE
jgi:chromosome segregation ATPase